LRTKRLLNDLQSIAQVDNAIKRGNCHRFRLDASERKCSCVGKSFSQMLAAKLINRCLHDPETQKTFQQPDYAAK
jgi:hypothetical protein